jgi:hypothetical protein
MSAGGASSVVVPPDVAAMYADFKTRRAFRWMLLSLDLERFELRVDRTGAPGSGVDEFLTALPALIFPTLEENYRLVLGNRPCRAAQRVNLRTFHVNLHGIRREVEGIKVGDLNLLDDWSGTKVAHDGCHASVDPRCRQARRAVTVGDRKLVYRKIWLMLRRVGNQVEDGRVRLEGFDAHASSGERNSPRSNVRADIKEQSTDLANLGPCPVDQRSFWQTKRTGTEVIQHWRIKDIKRWLNSAARLGESVLDHAVPRNFLILRTSLVNCSETYLL